MRQKQDNKGKRHRSVQFKVALAAVLFFISLMCGYASFRYFADIVNRTPEQIVTEFGEYDQLDVVIPLGSGTDKIADILKEMGVIKNTRVFMLLSKINGYDSQYRSGKHIISSKVDYNNLKGYDDLMRILSNYPVANPTVSVTIPEGYTYEQIADLMVDKGITTREDFDLVDQKGEFEYDFIAGIPGERSPRLEGYLFPETYIFDTKLGAEHIIGKMLAQFDYIFKDEYKLRAEELGMTTDQIIILASIIEREAMDAGDRALISGVFHNRLNSKDQSMHLLQSCATVQYGYLVEEGIFKTVITQNDLELVSPYNTYRNKGLPPGPISCPGKASIIAALYPDTTDGYYFFVAKGDGTHAFSKTFDEHVANMYKYDQVLN
ncbi:MAG: endolytic transglycosylase MltG [Eubacteriales bacterium]|nr:endolytic transglycosylase MltG [Eubacteriales bacterium]